MRDDAKVLVAQIQQVIGQRAADGNVVESDARMRFVQHPAVDVGNPLGVEQLIHLGQMLRPDQHEACEAVCRQGAHLPQFFLAIVIGAGQ
ncbi:hypothetical protein D3C85_1172740 [compost metagenome]